MKVNIGPYRQYPLPIYQIFNAYEKWRFGEAYLLDVDYNTFDRMVEKVCDFVESLVRPLNTWWINLPRRCKVQIDDYDVWSADHTLSLIILPVLQRLKEVKHGSGQVDLTDVPKNLRGDKDDSLHARWDWVLDEMIWAFEQHASDDEDTDQFTHNRDQIEYGIEELKDGSVSYTKFTNQKDPTRPAYFFDKVGLAKHTKRKDNGRRLFAKYYSYLWD